MQHITALAALLPLVAAHGFVNSPPPREPGDAYKAACGDQPFYQQSSDINGNVQGIYQVVGDSFDAEKCNLWLCKGFLLEDNPDNLQTYSLGETIEFDVNIAAPHTGYANVSVVKTSSNSIIGEPLIEFSNYAANAGVAANNSAFSVTLPESLGGDCTSAGDCVLQWFWDAPDIDQTYEACVDFVVGSGSGSGSGSSPSAVVSESAAPVETSIPEETEAASRTAVEVVTSAIEPQVPGATDAAETTAAAAESTAAAPETTEAPVADDEEDVDEDCEEDEYDDEEPIADEDEECDEDEEDDTTEPIADEDEECPADDEDAEYDDEYEDDASSGSSPSAAAVSAPASKPTAGAYNTGNYGSSNNNNNKAETVYITVSAETVTVTAPAAACTA